jgi:hypothetical protein
MNRALVIVRADDLLAFKLGKRNEWNDPAAVDVGSRDCKLPIGSLVLDDFQNTLSAWRPDRNDHDSAGLQLLQQRGRNMVDAAGNNDLVKRRRLFPTIIAVGSLALDCLKLLITILDELVVDRPRAVGQGLDDFYGVDLVGQMRELG